MDIEVPKRPLKRVQLVECARGAAAIYVCLYHVVLIGHLAEWFKWAKFLFYPLSFGQEAVFVFFFLSGFSIHYSSHDRCLNWSGGIGEYYYLRFRRIYPIFAVAVGLTIALGALTSYLGIASKTPCHPNARDLSFVLCFLTDWHTGGLHAGLANNPALWSLSYEIPYYLVYPLFWRGCKAFGVGHAFGISLMISAVSIVSDCITPNHVSNIFSLYWLWTCGALMAEWKMTGRTFNLTPAVYYLLLFLSYAICQSSEAVSKPVVNWNLEALTIGIVLISPFIDLHPLQLSRRILLALVFLVTLTGALWATRNVQTWGNHVFLDARLVFANGALIGLIITGFSLASICRILARPFLKWGAVSYGIYVVHMPILYFCGDLIRHFGSSFGWLPFALPLVACLAWCLEWKFQPWTAKLLDATHAKLVAVTA